MNSEEKIAVYVKEYIENAEELLKKLKSSRDWKVVKDRQLFAKSIFCSCICGEEWEQKDLELIINQLDNYVWYFEPQKDAWIIEQVIRSLSGKVDEDAIYLKLACIALLGDRETKQFIRAVMDIFYITRAEINADEKTLDILLQQTGSDWKKKIVQILVAHFGIILKGVTCLKWQCKQSENFIEYLISKDKDFFDYND